jgi:hypothetical protein
LGYIAYIGHIGLYRPYWGPFWTPFWRPFGLQMRLLGHVLGEYFQKEGPKRVIWGHLGYMGHIGPKRVILGVFDPFWPLFRTGAFWPLGALEGSQRPLSSSPLGVIWPNGSTGQNPKKGQKGCFWDISVLAGFLIVNEVPFWPLFTIWIRAI